MKRGDLELEQRPLATTRRRFVRGLAVGSVLTGFGAWSPLRATSAGAATAELRGPDLELSVGETAVNLTGRATVGTVVNGSLPGPVLRWREGDAVALRVRNTLAVDTAIHWHGLVLPAEMDGVPGLSFHGIPPGDTFTYRFPARQNGTYWYHAHAGFQEQAGVYGAIVIDPREPEPFSYDREHVVLLSDWTDRDPLELYRLLKRQPGYFNYNDRTLGDFVRDSKRDGVRPTLSERLAWGRMRMKPSDLADIGGHGYTYLMNGGDARGELDGFVRGRRARALAHHQRLGDEYLRRADSRAYDDGRRSGRPVRPARSTWKSSASSAAETLDVLVEPRGADAFTIFAQSIDRAGYARGTLAVAEGSAPRARARPDRVSDDGGHGSRRRRARGAASSAEHEHAAACCAATQHEHARRLPRRRRASQAPAAAARREHAGHRPRAPTPATAALGRRRRGRPSEQRSEQPRRRHANRDADAAARRSRRRAARQRPPRPDLRGSALGVRRSRRPCARSERSSCT